MRVLVLSAITALFAISVSAAPGNAGAKAAKNEKAKVEERARKASAEWTDHHSHDPGARGKDRAFQNIVRIYAINPESKGLQKAWANWVEENYQEGMDIDAVISEIHEQGTKTRKQLIADYEAQQEAPAAGAVPAAPAPEPAPAPEVPPPVETADAKMVTDFGEDKLAGGSGEDKLVGDQPQITIIEGKFVPAPSPPTAPEPELATAGEPVTAPKLEMAGEPVTAPKLEMAGEPVTAPEPAPEVMKAAAETVKAAEPTEPSGSTTQVKMATAVSAATMDAKAAGVSLQDASTQMQQEAMQSQMEAAKQMQQMLPVSSAEYQQMQLLQAEQQKQQEMLQITNSVIKALHETAMGVIRNIKG